MTEYFYRKPGFADYEQADSKKAILLVRLNNKYINTSQYFCKESNQWKDFDEDYDALIASKNFIPVEFTEDPIQPEMPVYHFNTICN